MRHILTGVGVLRAAMSENGSQAAVPSNFIRRYSLRQEGSPRFTVNPCWKSQLDDPFPLEIVQDGASAWTVQALSALRQGAAVFRVVPA